MLTKSESLVVPIVPVKNSVLFPGVLMPIVLSNKTTIDAIETALKSEDKVLGVFVQKNRSLDGPKVDDFYQTGTIAVIKKMSHMESMVHLIVQGMHRAELRNVTKTPGIFKVRQLPGPSGEGAEAEAVHRAILALMEKMASLVQPEIQVDLGYIVSEVKQPVNQVYLLASLLSLSVEKEIKILEAKTLREMFQLVYESLNHEVQVLELRNRITSRANSEMSKQQREYMLRQQMQAIQTELGEAEPNQAETAELRERKENIQLPDIVSNEVDKELARLERLSPASPEYQLSHNYVDLVLDLPWFTSTEDVLDLDGAQHILDEDHYGLEDIKQRIIEHLAVMKLNPQAKSPILCFVGPPGVGKTSVGRSIARALGRKFERMSLGGLHDEAELRGHRRTYIGAMPGRIIRAIRRAGVNNPLLMLDEIDKLGLDFRGDPAAALMEVLDPEQNVEFHDNYLDLPFDLTKVFFITTANTLDSIPGPLLDRMEVIHLPGYSEDEKKAIAETYLIRRQLAEKGLENKQVMISGEALNDIIRKYTREAGVRELERQIGRVFRKIATRFARGDEQAVMVLPEQLNELLGSDYFYHDQLRKHLNPGVAAGLAWTQVGGELLYVEAVLLPEGKEFLLTGQLGDVMQESARTAKSYLWSNADSLGIDKQALQQSGVHIHIPEGAVPKDGPSAGTSLVTALASLYSQKSVSNTVAMTGEITLSGLILPVGAIKEKVLAAHRVGIKTVVLPRENEKQVEKIPEHIRRSIEFVYVETIEDVLRATLPVLFGSNALKAAS